MQPDHHTGRGKNGLTAGSRARGDKRLHTLPSDQRLGYPQSFSWGTLTNMQKDDYKGRQKGWTDCRITWKRRKMTALSGWGDGANQWSRDNISDLRFFGGVGLKKVLTAWTEEGIDCMGWRRYWLHGLKKVLTAWTEEGTDCMDWRKYWLHGLKKVLTAWTEEGIDCMDWRRYWLHGLKKEVTGKKEFSPKTAEDCQIRQDVFTLLSGSVSTPKPRPVIFLQITTNLGATTVNSETGGN